MDSKKNAPLDKLLINHVYLTGTVVSYDKSTNHSFGIVRVKVGKSNVENIDFSKSDFLFPYRVKKNYAELYGYIPPEIKVGQTIILDSNQKSVKFYQNDSLLTRFGIYITNDERNIVYVRENTRFR
ncbi:hypothetical protein DHW03_05590 [Pedobacter yonginense]|uniref:Uncharacterized protein n=1 Tax=Pedobacter yonginense TaxID=651869 RepID=A0A317EQX2_9SPHI|nr:hypothetical protein [Pedobacter yonginense]PWS29290.1 hypothetical protein DHW03_05590 [Pedobacter yonginense]